jgi:hypothetical protein
MAASPDKVVRTDRKTGSGFAMPIKLFGEPLKPFPTFFANVRAHVRVDVRNGNGPPQILILLLNS